MKNIKNNFPFFKENPKTIYLDTAASAIKYDGAINSQAHFLRTLGVNTGRGMYQEAIKATNEYEKARKVVANFLGAKNNEIIFTSGATDSLNIISSSLSSNLTKDDNIIISILEHSSSYIPWYVKQKEIGFKIKTLPLTKDYNYDYKKLEQLIDNNTKYLITTMASNVIGCEIDIKKISDIAHKKGVVVIFDAAQIIPHKKINVEKLDVDFLAFSGHKLYGPNGIGVMYGKEELLNKMKPTKYGGGSILSFKDDITILKDVPYKFESGTPPISEAIALASAISFIESIGMDKIEKHEKKLTNYFLKESKKIPEIKLITQNIKYPIFSFLLKDIHPHDVETFLSGDNISIRVGFHCAERLLRYYGYNNGIIRISLGMYNEKSDIDKLIKTLKKVLLFFNKPKKEKQYGS